MTKEELIKLLGNYTEECENADTWYNSDLVEESLNIVEIVKNYLTNN